VLDSSNQPEDPINAFDNDLICSIKSWIEIGDQIILGIDANEDVRSGPFARRLHLECGLQEIMIRQLGLNLPNTYARGTAPIDGLFVSQALSQCPCGYTDIICNHRMLWMDVPVELALGYSPSAIMKASPKYLILQDPRIVKKYNAILQEHLVKHDVLTQLQKLETEIVGTLSPTQITKYNRLDNLRIQATLFAQQRCRKLKMGEVPYSPKLCFTGKKIRAWKLLLKKKSGGSVNTKYLHRKLKEAGITDTTLLSITDIQENLCNAWQSYCILKRSASGDQATWIKDLAMARAAEGKSSVAAEIKNLLLCET
jgi:hypothetical protein